MRLRLVVMLHMSLTPVLLLNSNGLTRLYSVRTRSNGLLRVQTRHRVRSTIASKLAEVVRQISRFTVALSGTISIVMGVHRMLMLRALIVRSCRLIAVLRPTEIGWSGVRWRW